MTRWHVHLSREAAATLRDASRSGAAVIAAALDRLQQQGPHITEGYRGDAEWSAQLTAGDHVLTVAGREGDTRIVIIQIQLVERHAAHDAVDVLPLAVSTRRRLAGLVQGLDLDLRYTLRALRRTPLFAAVVIVTLALGLGGTTALLDITRMVYDAALPFTDGDRLVRIRNANTSPQGDTRLYNLTPTDFELVRGNNASYSGVTAMAGRSLSIVGGDYAERVSAAAVSSNWARTLGIAPILGRTFSAEEDRAGSDAGVALISHSLWQRRFAADPGVLGKSLSFDGGTLTVIGVLAPRFRFPYDADVWTPWTFALNNPISSLAVFARLRDGVTIEAARQESERLQAARVEAGTQRSATAFNVATARSDLIRDDGRTVQALSAAVLFLLVLACVNVANLLFARFTTRRAELGLRRALGGQRAQQMRQMLVESLLLFGAGAVAAVLVGSWLRSALSLTVPVTLRTQLGLEVTGFSGELALMAFGIALVCGLAVGVAASVRALRVDPMTLLRQGGRGQVGRGDRRLFDVLVAAQLSLSLALLVGASLLIGRFRQLSATETGYRLDGVSTMRITIEQDRYRDTAARHRLVSTLEERLAALPGVEAVGITTVNPICCGDWGAAIEIEGRPVQPNEPPTLVAHQYVSPGYFNAMSIPLLRGAGFDRSDRPNGPLTVVVDEPFARMAWPDENPIGNRVRAARPNQPWRTVVGVVPVTVHDAEMRASWFLPYYQDPAGSSTEQLHIMYRGAVTTETMRNAVQSVDPVLAVYGTTTMDALWKGRTSLDRLSAVVAGVFAAFGLLLAGFSLYGLLSYAVELRIAEMGVRLALGASRASIVWLVAKQAAARLAAGLLFGLALVLGANQLLRSVVVGLEWVSWTSLLGLVAMLTLVSGVAAVLPALRATRADPMRSLRA